MNVRRPIPEFGEASPGKVPTPRIFLVVLLIHGAVLAVAGVNLWGPKVNPSGEPPAIEVSAVSLQDPAPPVPPPKTDLPPPPPLAADPDPAPSGQEPAVQVAPAEKTAPAPAEPDYLPPFKISQVPVIPADKLLAQIVYPALAAKQGIEATVLLDLYIDQTGHIRRVVVLKDPGYGFAEAAQKALQGLVCQPAQASGQAVAVRFRYPIRFSLK